MRGVHHLRLPGGLMPYHIQAQLGTGDVELLVMMFDQADPALDTCEIGTAYGGSAFLGACRAQRVGRRHWCVDQFGRPGAHLPDEPSMPVSFTALAVHGLERYAVLLPGSSDEVSALLAPAIFGALFVDGGHTPEWARLDTQFALAHVRPGGLVAYHDHRRDDDKYDDYTATVDQLALAGGWTELDHRGWTT